MYTVCKCSLKGNLSSCLCCHIWGQHKVIIETPIPAPCHVYSCSSFHKVTINLLQWCTYSPGYQPTTADWQLSAYVPCICGKLSITGRRVAMAAAYEYHGPQSLLTSLKGLVHSACVAADFVWHSSGIRVSATNVCYPQIGHLKPGDKFPLVK